MHKVLLYIAMLFATSLMANEIHWAKDFDSGIAKAQKENKPVLFVFSRHTCKYCVILEKTTFADKQVIEALNRDFVSIIAYSDENDVMPRELWRPGTPSIWFLMPSSQPMYRQGRNFPIMGAVGKKYFMQLLGKVKNDFDKRNLKKSGKK